MTRRCCARASLLWRQQITEPMYPRDAIEIMQILRPCLANKDEFAQESPDSIHLVIRDLTMNRQRIDIPGVKQDIETRR